MIKNINKLIEQSRKISLGLTASEYGTLTRKAEEQQQGMNEDNSLEMPDQKSGRRTPQMNATCEQIIEEWNEEKDQHQEATAFINDQILPYFNDSQKESVKLILKFLSNTNNTQPKITIAPDLSIIVDNDHIKSSNIIDILKKLVSSVPVRCINTENNSNCYKYLERASKIVGLKEVVTKLSLLNFPLTSIPNALVGLAMREMKS